jgi:ribulose-phosphate 3-epimerase
MAVVCPTVTAKTVDEYREQIELVSSFSSRVHIDLGDGKFTTQLIDISDIWWPDSVSADVHLMYQSTRDALRALVALKPNMVIVHAESEDPMGAIEYLRQHCITVGITLLQQTSVVEATELIKLSDHVLVFSGSLGSFGGRVDYSMLAKVGAIRNIRSDIEIGWDGGINVDNVHSLVAGGVDILNVGGAIQRANHPENVYRDLVRRIYS